MTERAQPGGARLHPSPTADTEPEAPRSEAAQALRRAEELVSGDRRTDYGPASESFAWLAEAFSLTLRSKLTAPIEPHEVALMMTDLKKRRCLTSPGSMDSWVDLAGYAALGWEIVVAKTCSPMLDE